MTFFKFIKRIVFIVFSIILLFVFIVVIFINQPSFGKLPAGDQLEKISQSPHYRDGKFNNLSPTPDLTEGVGYWEIIKEMAFNRNKRLTPNQALPSVKTDLLSIDRSEEVLVWFGHSSYFIQTSGTRILVDPVFSGSASPVSFGANAFAGTDAYTTDDLPDIDYLLLSHDHWDHLDYRTIKKLQPKVGKVICGLGTDAHLIHWGYDAAKISSHDWFEKVALDSTISIDVLPARHFSGRGLSRNKSLWVSFVVKTAKSNLYLGGDSGYDTHFKMIGDQYGPFDLAILENGQYDRKWRYIHMLPDELIQAAKDLNTKRMMPVHSAKFALANHAWDEPLEKVSLNASDAKMALVTPMIGEKVHLDQSNQVFTKWWKALN